MSTHYNPGHLSETKPPLWKRKWVPFAAIGAVGLLVGFGIGEAGKAAPSQKAPAPAVTVTATPSPAPTVTKTVEVTPASCLKALDLSEQGFTYAAEAMGYMSDALTAASEFNVAGLQKANADLDRVSPKMKELTTPMKSASAECRAGAK